MSALRALLERPRARVLVMGVLNRTPDSFSDGGALLDEVNERDYAILPKPFSRDQLLAAVKEILCERGGRPGG